MSKRRMCEFPLWKSAKTKNVESKLQEIPEAMQTTNMWKEIIKPGKIKSKFGFT